MQCVLCVVIAVTQQLDHFLYLYWELYMQVFTMCIKILTRDIFAINKHLAHNTLVTTKQICIHRCIFSDASFLRRKFYLQKIKSRLNTEVSTNTEATAISLHKWHCLYTLSSCNILQIIIRIKLLMKAVHINNHEVIL